jgi:hypothetical protein
LHQNTEKLTIIFVVSGVPPAHIKRLHRADVGKLQLCSFRFLGILGAMRMKSWFVAAMVIAAPASAQSYNPQNHDPASPPTVMEQFQQRQDENSGQSLPQQEAPPQDTTTQQPAENTTSKTDDDQ